MKVNFTAEQKRIITVAELPAAKEVISLLKDDTGLKDYAAIAARIATRDGANEILKAEAEIAKNHRIYNRYSEESGNLDIWLTVYAFNDFKGFYKIGAYLSDIWEVASENAEEIRSHMYIREFTERN